MTIHIRNFLFFALMSLAIWQLFEGGYIHAKAWLAQHLIHATWQKKVSHNDVTPPWPGADMHPVARLTAKKGDVDLMVLSDTSARTLAFGPGHMAGTTVPGDYGNVVMSGHRDTHFAFIEHLKDGEQLNLEISSGDQKTYEVVGSKVIHQREIEVALETGDDRITLITCYPFDSLIPGGPMRYAVIARALPPPYLKI